MPRKVRERSSSPAAAAGETLNSEKPKCRRSQVQLVVRRLLADNTNRRRHAVCTPRHFFFRPERAYPGGAAKEDGDPPGVNILLTTKPSLSNATNILHPFWPIQRCPNSTPPTISTESAFRPKIASTRASFIPELMFSQLARLIGSRGRTNQSVADPSSKHAPNASPNNTSHRRFMASSGKQCCVL